ncbi:MAG: hypothetical protein HY913_13890 [Desulfomonile tiedjei]|nr:hypothetical protein [Desulfomonile tiedjei]
MNTEPSKGRGNAIIGGAHFSMGRAIFGIVRGSVVLSLCFMSGFVMLSMGEPLLSVLMFVLSLLMLRSLLDLILSDRIIFYGNRVTKIWHILGSRTIYFSRAKVWRQQSTVAPPIWLIRETAPNDQRRFIKKQIEYDPRFFPSEAAEEILSRLVELAGGEVERTPYSRKDWLIAGTACFTMFLFWLLTLYLCGK